MDRDRSTKRLPLLIAIFFVSISVWSFWKAYAATRTWTGASLANPNPALRNNLWLNQFNWSGNLLPQPGDDLVFAGGPPSSNNYPSGTTFNSISIGGGHVMTGNSVALDQGVIATGGQISLASIRLNSPQDFDAPVANQAALVTSAIDTNDKILVFRGPGTFLVPGIISGSGIVQRRDNGVTILTANNSYTGLTLVIGGTLVVNGSQAQSRVVVQTGGALGGGGTVGNVVVQSGGGVPSRMNPGNTNNGTAILNVGNVKAENNPTSSILEFDLKSATVGSGYDQLNVSGEVDLGAQPSTLQINLSFLPSPGTSFTIINNDGSDAVLSTFAGLPEGATLTINGITLVISYKGGDGNDVVLRVPQTKVWDGGGTTNNWSDAANWVGDVAPGFGDSLEFPAGTARLTSTNNFVANTVFNSINFSGGGYHINGNGIALNAGINNTAVSANGIAAPILIARPQSFITSLPGAGLFINSVNLENKTLTLDGAGFNAIQGVISGTGSVVQTGTGESGLGGANSYTGVTTIDTGTLHVNGSQPNSAVNVFNGVLKGGGIVGPLVAFGGKVSPDRPVLTVSGNAVLHDSSTLEINTFIAGTVLHGQLNVNGSVTITNSSLSVLPAPAVPTAPTTVIVSNDGSDPVVGTFAGLAEGAIITAGTHQFRISYVGGDGNDVVLVRLAVTRRWDGGSPVNSNWRTKENWEGDVAPLPGDSLEFPAGAARLTTSNDFVSGTHFNSITFSGAGYTHSGAGISLSAGVNETVTSGEDNRLLLPISLNASQSFVTAGPNGRVLRFNSVVLGDKSLSLDGTGPCNIASAISGSGTITRRGSGLSVLSGANTYTGSTIVESGTLRMNGTQPGSAVTVINGTLEGGGTLGSLVATGGKVSPSTFESSSTLTVAGNVTFNQAATLEIRRVTLNSIPGLMGLKVNGTVDLGGSTLAIVPSFTAPANTPSVIIDNDGSEPVNGTFAELGEGSIITAGFHRFQLSYVGGDGNDVTLTFLGSAPPDLQFSTNSYSVAENVNQVTLTVFKIGDASSAATVDYRTTDTDNFTVGCFDSINNQGGAFGRCDFSTEVGTLTFGPNEQTKQIHISIIDDVIVEGNETFQVVLENPVGATVGTLSTATVTINSDDVGAAPNPIFQSPFFVRQHYRDFLSREPELDGFNAWLNVLNGCPDVNNLDPNSPSAQCDRIIVSQSFFGSQEFQIKGFYVFRFYKLAFNRLPEYLEIISDMSFVAGATSQEVFLRKEQLVSRFMQRQEFQTTYGSLSNSDFVNLLMSRYQLTQITTPDPQQPNGTQKVTFTATDLTNRLNATTLTRAQVFRAIADSDQVSGAEFNNAFVAMQYYGYLRRKPDLPGFNAWLQVLQSGNIRVMINGFMNSQEYRLRFGPP